MQNLGFIPLLLFFFNLKLQIKKRKTIRLTLCILRNCVMEKVVPRKGLIFFNKNELFNFKLGSKEKSRRIRKEIER